MTRQALGTAAIVAATVVVAVTGGGCGEPASSVPVRQPVPSADAAPAPATAVAISVQAGPWIDPRGTSIVGFGLLRLVPGSGGAAEFRLRYREIPDGYASGATGAVNLQLFVLPADAFAAQDRAYADAFLAFTRTEDDATTDEDGALSVETTVTATAERTVIVAYGPWTAPDAGRPAGDVPTFRIDVSADPASDGAAFEWIESEAGELITTNWTNRPQVSRGGPVHDDVTGADAWIEVRPMILYDGRMVRAADEPATAARSMAPSTPSPAELRAEAARLDALGDAALAADRRERAADLESHLLRADGRMVVTRELAEKFRRVPIRWR